MKNIFLSLLFLIYSFPIFGESTPANFNVNEKSLTSSIKFPQIKGDISITFREERSDVTHEKYLKKGSKVYLEGQLETRSWEQDGQKKYTTEVVLRPYRGELTMLDSRSNDNQGYSQQAAPMAAAGGGAAAASVPVDPMEDDIPF